MYCQCHCSAGNLHRHIKSEKKKFALSCGLTGIKRVHLSSIRPPRDCSCPGHVMDGCHKESILLTRTPGCISFTPCLQITTDSLCVMQSTMWMCLWADRNTQRDMHERHSVLQMLLHTRVKVRFELSKANHYLVHKHHMKHHPTCLNQKKCVYSTDCLQKRTICMHKAGSLITELLRGLHTSHHTVILPTFTHVPIAQNTTNNNSRHITAKEI